MLVSSWFLLREHLWTLRTFVAGENRVGMFVPLSSFPGMEGGD